MIIALAIGGLLAWKVYELRSGKRAVEDLAERLKRAGDELYQKQLADTVGGKTPQETLRMYIEAVEKGDYELASKYFVIEKQEDQLKNLQKLNVESKHEYLQLLEKVLVIEGGYETTDKRYYSFEDPILVRMALYPSGVWKILDI